MKIIYIGSDTPLSIIPFQTLIESKHTVCALAFDDKSNSEINVTKSGTIQSIALDNSIPFIKLNEKYTDAVSHIQSYQPDIIIVSCYARLLPQSILSIAKKGSFNIHPSLLPKFRGPTPLFWQFREGVKNFGVTIHRMTEEFDAGDILSQEKIILEDGINNYDATQLLANGASWLLVNSLNDIENNKISIVVQNDCVSSYQSFPANKDYSINTSWTAKRIYNFIKACKGSGVIFYCEMNNENFKIIDVYSYQNNPYFDMKGNLYVQKGKVVTFACQNGYIQVEIVI